MCTFVILRRPDHNWPVIVAANRDEMNERAWRPPGRHWPDRPEVIAGMDELAGGSWFGLNDHGLVAGILNRTGSLGPADGKRSRGELVLDALGFSEAADAMDALRYLSPTAYRPFNMIIADNRNAYWLRHDGATGIAVQELPTGISMITDKDLNDLGSPRIERFLPQFKFVQPPDVDAGDWRSWTDLMMSTDSGKTGQYGNAMYMPFETGFGTVCSSLVALPADVRMPAVAQFQSAPLQPDGYAPINLS